MGKVKMEVDEDVKPTKAELETEIIPAPTTEKVISVLFCKFPSGLALRLLIVLIFTQNANMCFRS